MVNFEQLWKFCRTRGFVGASALALALFVPQGRLEGGENRPINFAELLRGQTNETMLFDRVESWVDGVSEAARGELLVEARTNLLLTSSISEETRWDILNLLGHKLLEQTNNMQRLREAGTTFALALELPLDDFYKALALKNLATTRLMEGNHEAANLCLKKLTAIAETTRSERLVTAGPRLIAEVFEMQVKMAGDSYQELRVLSDAENFARTYSGFRNEGKLEILKVLADVYFTSPTLTTNYAKAMDLYAEVRDGATNDFSKADSLRMISEIAMLRGDPKLASSAAKEVSLLLSRSNDPKVNRWKEFFAVSSLSHAALANQVAGDFASSVALRENLASGLNLTLNRDQKINLYLELARDYGKLTNHTMAITHYDRLLGEFPDYGQTNGLVLDLKFERINALPGGTSSTNNLELLEALWEDYREKDWVQTYVLGGYLVRLYSDLNATNQYVHLLTLLSKTLATNYLRIAQKTHDERIGFVYQDVLMRLGGYYAQKRDYALARPCYENLIRLFPRSALSSTALQRISFIEAARHRYTPKGLFVLAFVTLAFLVPALWLWRAKHCASRPK